jgi:hypothetical protein
MHDLVDQTEPESTDEVQELDDAGLAPSLHGEEPVPAKLPDPNLRGHAGGGLSLGRGFPVISSTKQKLNARTSAESELVGADDFMPAACWTRCFMEAQGCIVKENVSCQGNKSSIQQTHEAHQHSLFLHCRLN